MNYIDKGLWYILDVNTREVLATANTRHERMQKSMEMGRGSYIIEWRELDESQDR